MLATIRDDTWNVLNMQRIRSDIPGGGTKSLKDPPIWLKVTTTLEKYPPPPPH